MSFYIRRLRTLRRMPVAKKSLSFGFSTRFCSEWNSQTSTIHELAACSMDNVGGAGNLNMALTLRSSLLSSCEENYSFFSVIPLTVTAAMVPSSLKEIQYILLDRKSVLIKSCPSVLSLRSKDILNMLSSSVKSIRLTSDDILVDPLGVSQDLDPFISRSCENERVPGATQTPNSDPDQHDIKNINRTPAFSLNQQKRLSSIDISHLGPFSVLSKHTTAEGPKKSDSDVNNAWSVHTLNYSSGGGNGAKNSHSSKDGPTPEQLYCAKERLEVVVSNIFNGRHDYSLLHKNVVFENNLFGDNHICNGIQSYAFELMKLRLRVHARYSKTDMEVLHINILEQNGVIRIHWRLKGVPQTQVLKFWRLFQSKKFISSEDFEWLEAFSYFHIGKDGLVHRHRIDRMMPDDERETNNLKTILQDLMHPAKPLVS